MTPALFTHLPDLPATGGLLLELGCGDGLYAPLLRSTGFEYVGLDIDGEAPDVLVDAHRLPFREGSIDAVVAISLLEHLRTPAAALREIARVLRPGATIVGSVAFLEPYHQESYFHHTHLGTLEALSDAGLEVVVVAPAADWSGLRALAEMALFTGWRRIVGRTMVSPLQIASRVWWSVLRRAGRLPAEELERTQLSTGGFRFVARRPGVSEQGNRVTHTRVAA